MALEDAESTVTCEVELVRIRIPRGAEFVEDDD